jgi:hypothetical protein
VAEVRDLVAGELHPTSDVQKESASWGRARVRPAGSRGSNEFGVAEIQGATGCDFDKGGRAEREPAMFDAEAATPAYLDRTIKLPPGGGQGQRPGRNVPRKRGERRGRHGDLAAPGNCGDGSAGTRKRGSRGTGRHDGHRRPDGCSRRRAEVICQDVACGRGHQHGER